MTDFVPFGKIPRLSRECVVTEKIDGSNAVVWIGEDGEFKTGSRTRWITPEQDNYGFAAWAHRNKEELLALGPGFHYGEWWGAGIQKRYSRYMDCRKFSLFNVSRWGAPAVRPECCEVVPTLYTGPFDTQTIEGVMDVLAGGSVACPGCPEPEGVVVFHPASKQLYKKTFEADETPKALAKAA